MVSDQRSNQQLNAQLVWHSEGINDKSVVILELETTISIV